MDDSRNRRRQNDPPIHPSSNPRYSLADPSQQRRSYTGTTSDRYRPAPLNTSPSTARGMGGAASYSGYYQEPVAAFSTGITQNTMGYQSEYGQDARQTQSFGAYNPNLMYNVPQANTQNPVYDTSQQFSSRQPAGLQMMTADVTTPYFGSEPTNAATAPGLQPQTAASNTPASVYQQSPADRTALLQNYSGGIPAMGNVAQSGSAADVSMEDQDYPAAGGLDEAYAQYQSALKEIFQNIKNGVLAAASESLLNVSDWLLSHVAELGLTSDDQNLHSDRIGLWNDFNHAWLAICQRQLDFMESGQQLQRPQSLITEDGLKKMGNELVRLCDSLERHGLVDYQYGVAEEQIVDALDSCLELYSPNDETGSAAAGSSSHQVPGIGR